MCDFIVKFLRNYYFKMFYLNCPKIQKPHQGLQLKSGIIFDLQKIKTLLKQKFFYSKQIINPH